MNEFPQEALLFHLLAIGLMLSVICYLLRRQGLFHWLSAGFWMVAAIFLYFFFAPLMNWVSGQTHWLERSIAVTEGVPRLQWVTFLIVVGTACFYVAYFHTRERPVTLGLRDDQLPAGTWIIMTLSLLASAYAILFYRASFGVAEKIVIEGGKFTGDVTGYHYVAHIFALFPLVIMLAYKKTRNIGLLLTVCWLAARFEDRMDRQSTVSLLLAISMLDVSRRRKQRPDVKWILAIVLITLILTIRGHTSFLNFLESDSFNSMAARDTVTGSGDTTMLSTLWVHTYLSDHMGYNYGIPFLNNILFGFLPRKYFPWKDNVIEPVAPIETTGHYRKAINLIFGAKSTMIGDVYSWGGIVTVALGMAFLGYLSRRLDGMVTDKIPLPVRVLGFLWVGGIWMLYASGLTWSAQYILLTGLPFLGLYLCGKLFDNPHIILTESLPESLEKRGVGSLPDIEQNK